MSIKKWAAGIAAGIVLWVATVASVGLALRAAETPREPAHAQVYRVAEEHVWLVRPDSTGLCTGFYIGDGFVVTAAHCFQEDADGFASVERPGMAAKGGDPVDPQLAMVVAISEHADMALLMTALSGPGLAIADFPDVRDDLYAVGIPGELGTSILVQPVKIHGIVYERKWYYANSLGADIWPGMSGGPLLRSDGTVFGVITYTREYAHDEFKRDMGGYSILLKQWVDSQRLLWLGKLD